MGLDRRHFLAGLSAIGMGAALPGPVNAQDFGLVPDPGIDQTGVLQAAIDTAASEGRMLAIPAGRFVTRTLTLPSGMVITGMGGQSVLVHAGDGPLLDARDGRDIVLRDIGVQGDDRDGDVWHGGLIHIERCANILIERCRVSDTRMNGIALHASSGMVRGCEISNVELAGLFVYDATGMTLSTNGIHDCRNGGIRVWRGESASDGTIVTGNRIRGIDWTNGGNGQNGNGVNIFRADDVIVSDNHISDCTFSAIRLNATNNTQVRGNTCLNSGEVAIFSEFAFSGSVISNNIVDGAAAGISMTNYIDGGRLASCTGNIVRNLHEGSEVNPDLTTPYGIAAEADAVVSGNVIDSVAGIGILAGWGPYLRDVAISGNLVRDIDVGIAVSVADGAGSALIADNMISGARRHAMTANRWDEIAASDLAGEADRFPQLTVRGNAIL